MTDNNTPNQQKSKGHRLPRKIGPKETRVKCAFLDFDGYCCGQWASWFDLVIEDPQQGRRKFGVPLCGRHKDNPRGRW